MRAIEANVMRHTLVMDVGHGSGTRPAESGTRVDPLLRAGAVALVVARAGGTHPEKPPSTSLSLSLESLSDVP
ncbi:hypothetical protein GCM10025789_28420 [Tessaracoccus lubricantis]|uniref:MurNAc-LAA domain-containing protein n=1 Tax=Tessaracoccus lubricantis TaxID=545543 RepID=A0ABP9FMS1_9ACTN